MKRVFLLLVLLAGTLCPASPLRAHSRDMQNLERLTELRLRPDGVDLRVGLQYREFPGLAVRGAMDSDADGVISPQEQGRYLAALRDSLLGNVSLSLNGTALRLEPSTEPQVEYFGPPRRLPQHLDLTFDYSAVCSVPADSTHPSLLSLENRNDRPEPGRESFVLIAEEAVRVVWTSLDSTASPVGPESLRRVRLGFSRVEGAALERGTQGASPWRLVLDRWTERAAGGTASSPPVAAGHSEEEGKRQGAFQNRVSRFFEQGSAGGAALWLLLLAAFVYGGFHALEPGHAKTITAVYLLGSGQRWPRALLLALTVTLTHTGGVFLLALVTSLAWGGAPGPAVQAALGGISGAIILALGLQRLRAGAAGHTHPHSHPHPHGHAHSEAGEHSHAHDEKGSKRGVIWLGVAGGLAPCPGALWIYFLALGFGRPALAVLLILALSLGLAAVLVTVGLVSLYLGDIFAAGKGAAPAWVTRSRSLSALWRAGAKAFHAAPAVAGVLLVLVGSFMLWRSLGELGLSGLIN
ncbi:sulfite exporter TauE/SafE family protein [bacterium]|nr:sulfite exporter TauE/SafE family protein [bacterium]